MKNKPYSEKEVKALPIGYNVTRIFSHVNETSFGKEYKFLPNRSQRRDHLQSHPKGYGYMKSHIQRVENKHNPGSFKLIKHVIYPKIGQA